MGGRINVFQNSGHGLIEGRICTAGGLPPAAGAHKLGINPYPAKGRR